MSRRVVVVLFVVLLFVVVLGTMVGIAVYEGDETSVDQNGVNSAPVLAPAPAPAPG